MLEGLRNSLAPKFGAVTLKLKYHAPEIYLGTGLLAGVASVVLIARAHKAAADDYEDLGGQITALREWAEEEDDEEEEIREGLRRLYLEGGKLTVKTYGPGFFMGAASLGLILASHGLMRQRNQALLATMAVIERSFSTYRGRVITELGEEADERFYYGAESRKVTTMVKDKDGKKKKKRGKKNHIPEKPDPIMYQRLFDDTNHHWYDKNDELREFFLRTVETHSSDILRLRGHIMLNEVYKALGFPETPEGAVVGWSMAAPGDNFVDLGLDKDINQREGDNRWLLDFNVNGPIFEYIGAEEED